MTPRVLLTDNLSILARQTFEQRGIEVTVTPKMDEAELIHSIPDFDGLVLRSSTQVTAKALDAANRLKVVGRAGIGIDNIDLAACTARGIVVMNTPHGNAVTTAEHAIALIFAAARNIPQASASTHAGKWEKTRFTGMELSGKTLGLIGAGKIGSIVAQKALALGLKVMAYDPFLSPERARSLGIIKSELHALLANADIVTLHVPKTPQTEEIIDASALNYMKRGAMLINCARGGLVDELALKVALESGHLRAAALDVFAEEPATENLLFGLENLICTPHLGASTSEAQEKVAQQIAEQMSDYLLEGAIQQALNAPSLTAEEGRKLAPYLKLAEQLGSFAGQLTKETLHEVQIEYAGAAAALNTKPLTNTLLASLLRPQLSQVNMVNAGEIAKMRGIEVKITTSEAAPAHFSTLVSLNLKSETRSRGLKGTLFGDSPRLVEIKGITLESRLGPHMIYLTNQDQPGSIGAIGQHLADAGINIAKFYFGRVAPGGDAIALLEIDSAADAQVLSKLRALPSVQAATYLAF